jgi:hypothetical protein
VPPTWGPVRHLFSRRHAGEEAPPRALTSSALGAVITLDALGVMSVEGEGSDAGGAGWVVVVRKLAVCSGVPALWVHAVTPRPRTAGARKVKAKRVRERFMIVPFGVSGRSRDGPSEITLVPVQEPQKPPKVRSLPTSQEETRGNHMDFSEANAHARRWGWEA